MPASARASSLSVSVPLSSPSSPEQPVTSTSATSAAPTMRRVVRCSSMASPRAPTGPDGVRRARRHTQYVPGPQPGPARSGPARSAARGPGCGGLGPGDAGHVAPQALELVVLAGLVEEDVDDHVAVVDEHPVPVVEALDTQRFAVTRLVDDTLDVVDDGLD